MIQNMKKVLMVKNKETGVVDYLKDEDVSNVVEHRDGSISIRWTG